MELTGAKPRILAVAVIVAAIGVHAGTVGHGFVFDDGPEVVDNDWIRSLAGLPNLFLHSAWEGSGDRAPIYRPLTSATYALNYAVGGLSPVGYHLVNVLLHALVAVLVVALGREIGLSFGSAFVAGVLFAVHPVHVEVVANVAGRKDSLAALFVIAAVLAHARASRRGGGWAIAAPLAFAAAMLSKETGVTAIGLVLAWDLAFARGEWRRRKGLAVALYATYAVELAAYLAARWATVGSLGIPLDHIPYVENPLAHVGAGQRIVAALGIVGRGIGLLLAPVKLSPDYSYGAVPVGFATAIPYALLAVGACASAAVAARRARAIARPATFALIWYGIALLPASNLLFPVGTAFGERLLYLPSVGFCLAAGAAVHAALAVPRGQALRWALGACAVVLAARTAAYARVWSDELTLYSAGVEAQPRSVKMRSCLGAVLMEAGRPADALPHFEAAIGILEGAPAPMARHRLELGVAYERLGRLADAARQYQLALRESPDYPDALWRMGVVRWSEGREPDAVALWLRTVAVDPGHARALSDLGIAYESHGDASAAKRMWERAIAADPRLASAWYRLGEAYERDGDRELAFRAWTEFVRHENGRFPMERAEVIRKLARMRDPR